MGLILALPHLPRLGETIGERLESFPGRKRANQALPLRARTTT